MDNDNLLRAYRERFGTTQREIGALLGLTGDAIGNYETRRVPSLPVALGMEIIFGKALADLFPLVAYSVAHQMLERLADWSIELEGRSDEASIKKRALVAAIGERLARILPDA